MDVVPQPVEAKIRPPRIPASAITRSRLHRRLDEIRDHRMTLVTAPAGFGKSWAVADWLEANPHMAACWVSVDTYDRDPVRLWLHVAESIRQLGIESPIADFQSTIRQDIGVPRMIDLLVSALAGFDEDLAIVFDDAHLATGEATTTSFDQFLTELPQHVHVVLIGRHQPDVPLAKWRISGNMLEIRAEELRCDHDECTSVITEAMGLDLSDDLIREIEEKTTGWMAGIRLAAGGVAAAGDDATKSVRRLPNLGSIGTTSDAVADYLVEEALDHLPESERRFLEDTSILDHLSGPLCDALTGREDSAVLLERLARAGMFTSRSAGSGAWYQYHDLFRSSLLLLLHRTTPEREARLHGAAARWYNDHGDPVRAITHAVAADDAALAARWLAEAGGALLITKQYDTLDGLIREIDEASSAPLPPTLLMTWCFVVLYGDMAGDEIDQVLDRTQRRLSALSDEERRSVAADLGLLVAPWDSLEEFVTSLRAASAHRRGDRELARACVAALPAQPSPTGWVEAVAGEIEIFAGRYAEGRALVRRWMEYSFSSQDPIVVNTAVTSTILAWAHIGEGQLTEADQIAAWGLATMEEHGLAGVPQYATAVIPAAWVAWERGDLDMAERLLANVAQRIDRLGEIPAYVFAHSLLGRVHFSRGRPEEAIAALRRATVIVEGRAAPALFADILALERARIALLRGDGDRAELELPDWRERLERGAGSMREHHLLTRMALTAGEDVSQLLASHPAGLEMTSAQRIEQHKLAALVAIADDDQPGALGELSTAMEVAHHTGHRQTFLDDRLAFGALLDNAAALTGYRLRLPGRVADFPATPEAQPGRLVEPLTERELDVLSLLPTHLTYQEIARQLSVSPNTVKAYVKAIYRKLDSDRRSQAVTAARELGLVD